jgi:methylase of polypeptide subunit release factors
MTHAIHRVEGFEIVDPYTLALRFEDGTHQRIDFRPVLEGELCDEVRALDRVLDMGTGCGVNAILAASLSPTVVGVETSEIPPTLWPSSPQTAA